MPWNCGTARKGSETGEISVAALHDSLMADPDIFIVDVRTLPEWEARRIIGVKKFIPYDEIPARHAELGVGPGTPIYLICRVGNRSGVAAEMLADLGYKRAINVVGGTTAWVEDGYPTESGPILSPAVSSPAHDDDSQ